MSNDTPAAAEARYQEFLALVLETRVVWGLKTHEGWAQWSEDEDEDVIVPFWSDRAAEERCANISFLGYHPETITLTEFLESWLPQLKRNGQWAGVNLLGGMVGIEMAPDVLEKTLREAGG